MPEGEVFPHFLFPPKGGLELVASRDSGRCFQFPGIPPKGELIIGFVRLEDVKLKFPISRDPPEGGTLCLEVDMEAKVVGFVSNFYGSPRRGNSTPIKPKQGKECKAHLRGIRKKVGKKGSGEGALGPESLVVQGGVEKVSSISRAR
jgi:hypothetical protein